MPLSLVSGLTCTILHAHRHGGFQLNSSKDAPPRPAGPGQTSKHLVGPRLARRVSEGQSRVPAPVQSPSPSREWCRPSPACTRLHTWRCCPASQGPVLAPGGWDGLGDVLLGLGHCRPGSGPLCQESREGGARRRAASHRLSGRSSLNLSRS